MKIEKRARAGVLRKLNRMPYVAPFLVALAIFANALTLVIPNFYWRDILTTLAIVLAITGLVTWCCYHIFKRSTTGAFAAALTVLVLAYFNTIEAKFLEWLLNSPFRFMARAVIIIGLIGAICAAMVWWFHKKASRRRRANVAMILAAGAMLVVPIIQNAATWYRYQDIFTKPYWANTSPVAFEATIKPDIYFIIFDSFTSNESLLKYWGYDNSEFSNYLCSKGFHVVHNSKSKYMNTQKSIASILNMVEDDVHDRHDIPQLLLENLAFKYIAKSEVIWRLKQMGYEIQNLSLFRLENHKRFYRIKNFSIGVREILWTTWG